MANLLRSYGQSQDNSQMPQSNQQPQFTPFQDQQQMGPNMGQVNGFYGTSPNGSIMPNWNRQ